MEQELQDLIDQLRDIAPSLRNLSQTTGSATDQSGNDKLIMALAKLSTNIASNTKSNSQKQKDVDKFVKEVDKGADASARARKAREKLTATQTAADTAERERIRRASLTADAKDREDQNRRRQQRADANREKVAELRSQKQVRNGAAELADEYLRGLNATSMFNNKLEDMAGESVGAQLALKGFASAGTIALKGLGDFGKSLGSFGNQLAQGNTSFETLNPLIDSVAGGLADLADAIPFAGGALSASIKLVAEGSKFVINQLQQASDAFNSLANTGGLLDDGMTGVYKGFLESGMQLNAYTKVIENNSMALARFGLTVGDGRVKFERFLGQIVDSRAGDELRRIGFNTNQIGETAAAFLTQQTRLGLSQRKTQAQLTLQTSDYAKELDLLSKLTGKQREEIISQQDSALSEGRFRAATDQMIARGQETTAKALLDFQSQVNAISPELGEAVRDTASGFINSQAAIKGFNSSGGAIVGIVDAVKTGQISTGQALERLQDATQGAEARQRDFASAVGDGQDVFVKYAEISDFNRALVQGSSVRAQVAQDAQTAGTDNLTNSVVEAQRNMEQLGRQLNNFGFQVMPQAAKAVGMFTSALNEFVNYVSEELEIDLPNITAQLNAQNLPGPGGSGSNVSPRPEVTATGGHTKRNQRIAQQSWDARYGSNYNPDGTPKNPVTIPVSPEDVPSRPGTQQAPVVPLEQDQPNAGPAPTSTAPATAPGPNTNNVVPRPTASGHSGRNAKRKWDDQYGKTHNPDGSLKAQPAPVVPPSDQSSAVVPPAPPAPSAVTQNVPPRPAAGSLSETAGMPASDGSTDQNLTQLASAFSNAGFENQMITASLANVMKESGGQPVQEGMSYSSVDRIRSVFGGNKTAAGGRVRDLPDAELAKLVRNPKALGDFMYGHKMGNEGQGFDYRGRGYIQLTGKNNYASASDAIFGDDRMVKNPDLAAQPDVAAQVAAWFMKTNAPAIASQMGIDAGGAMSQDQANLLATSTIAGRKLTPGKSFAGTEGLNKVGSLAGSMASFLPQAQNGGVVKGPMSGYAVNMHGDEAVVPLPGGKKIPVNINNSFGQTGNNITENSAFPDFAGLIENTAVLSDVQSSLASMVEELKANSETQNSELQSAISNMTNKLSDAIASNTTTTDPEMISALREIADLTRSNNSTAKQAVAVAAA